MADNQTPPGPPDAAHTPRRSRLRVPYIRVGVAVMLFLAAILNYIDRQTLSILAPTVQADLKLSDIQYGQLANLFLIAYTVSLLLSGRLVDKLGTRFAMPLFVGVWSLANMATGWVKGFASLGACRFVLGLGEAGNWPASAKVVSEWFPARERALAIGFYTLGATIGATIAPVLINHLATGGHWQYAFVFTGALGILWVIPWLLFFRKPAEHPHITPAELQLLEDDARRLDAAELASGASAKTGWIAALADRNVWLLMFARTLSDPVWFFYQFWFAKYLVTERGFTQMQLAMTWLIFLAADIGAIGGGYLSGHLVKRGTAVAWSRLTVMAGCAMLMPLSPLVALSPSIFVCFAVAMIACLAHLAWQANISALIVDRIPKANLATGFGIIAAGSAMGGIAMNSFVGYWVTKHSYAGWFWIMAFLHPLAWAILYFGGIHRARTKPTT
jgi:MFS transporter, ACS family, hexuronate transporter